METTTGSVCRWKLLVAGVAIWLAFFAFALYLHTACAGVPPNDKGWVDIAGLDGEAYLYTFRDCRNIYLCHFRHPLVGVVLSPLYVTVRFALMAFGPMGADVVILMFFALVGAANAIMLWLVTGRFAAVLLWLSFGYTWLLGGMAELFGISQFVLLAVLWFVRNGRLTGRAAVALAILAGGVTVTNGAKPILAWLATRGGLKKDDMRNMAKAALLLAAIVLVGGVCLIAKWKFHYGISVSRGIASLIGDNGLYLSSDLSFVTRLRYAWEMFFCEPLLASHGPLLGASVFPFHSTACAVAAGQAIPAVLLGLSAFSAWKNRRDPMVRTLLAMLSVDFVIHILIGWGATEGQIYCGHWFFAVPVLISLLWSKKRECT